MLRIILGVIIGFIVWTSIRLGGNDIVIKIAPSIAPNADFSSVPTSFVIILFVLGLISSLTAGFIAVLISREQSKTTLILGGLLLLVGIFFQAMAWNILPLWYHLLFLISLIPMTILGGRIRNEELRKGN